MTLRRWAPFVALAATTMGCFHQTVQTGRTAGTTVIDKPFVNTWVFGLVAAPDIDVTKECPNGVAIVETEQSFVNGLVAALTLGIYTPQHAKITCAASRSAALPSAPEMRLPAGASAAERTQLMEQAIETAIEQDTPVVVRF